MITVASFRTDLPEFQDNSAYSDSVVAYWIAIAQIMMGLSSGTQPQVASFSGTMLGQVLTVASIDFGSFSLLPLALSGNSVPANSLVLSQITGSPGGPGTYNTNFSANIGAEQMVALANTATSGGNPFWGPTSVVAASPPTTLADFATEMFVAHNLVLEWQALQQANSGGAPGTQIGVVTSKSVGGVSVSYDVSQIVDQNSGFWGQTQYGLRFIRLARLRGSGPIQIGIGIAPAFLFFNSWGLTGSYNAWAGPAPFVQQSDTGFA